MTWKITKNVSVYDVKDMFIKADRDYFSYDALEVIMNDLEEFATEKVDGDRDMAVIDLDIIAVACDWVEESVFSAMDSNYNRDDYLLEEYNADDHGNEEEYINDINNYDVDRFMEHLQDDTYAVQLSDTVLYRAF